MGSITVHFYWFRFFVPFSIYCKIKFPWWKMTYCLDKWIGLAFNLLSTSKFCHYRCIPPHSLSLALLNNLKLKSNIKRHKTIKNSSKPILVVEHVLCLCVSVFFCVHVNLCMSCQCLCVCTDICFQYVLICMYTCEPEFLIRYILLPYLSYLIFRKNCLSLNFDYIDLNTLIGQCILGLWLSYHHLL